MKKTIYTFAIIALTATAFTSCSSDDSVEPETITIDTAQPNGTFTSSAIGDFVEENGSGSDGSASLGTDTDGTQFIEFSSDFTTNFATGTVTVYLSTSDTYTADPGNGNPDLLLVGPVKSGGSSYLKVDPTAASKFTHVILWCGSANVPFGNAELK